MSDISVTFLDETPIVLGNLLVSAVFLIAISPDGILVVKNERGWDIPGGHLEKDESPYDALEREVMEEAGVIIKKAEPYAILSGTNSHKAMLFFFADNFELTDFFPKSDAFERNVIAPIKFLEKYYGDKVIMSRLIEKAKELIMEEKGSDTFFFV